MTTVKERTRVAVIGAAGEMGGLHTDRLTELDDVTIVALADPNEAVAAPRAEALSARWFATIDALERAVRAGEIELDGVVVAVANALHETAAMWALDLGIPVFCEKPIAHDLASAARMLAAAEQSGTHLTIGYHLPHHPEVAPQIAAARERIGELRAARLSTLRRDAIPNRPAFTDAALTGGGSAVDLSGHVWSVLTAVTGPVEIVAALGTTYPRRVAGVPDAEEWAAGTVTIRSIPEPVGERLPGEVVVATPRRVADGAVVMFESSWRAALPHDAPDESWRVELRGSAGSVVIELPHNEGGLPAYGPQMAAWVAQVRGEVPWDVEGTDSAWRTQQAITALYDSAAAGGTAATVEAAPALAGEAA